ncbi:MAG: hypothetical protein ABI678_05590 [Kofleriaceae bacterium]
MLLSIATVSTVSADTFWSLHYNGSSCQPDENSGPNMLIDNGVVRFAPGKIGQIILYCPLSHRPQSATYAEPSVLELYYSDSDPELNMKRPHAFVNADYELMSKHDAYFVSLAVASSQNGVQDGTFWMKSVPVPGVIAFDYSVYYIAIVMHRDDPTQEVAFYGVALR